MPLQKLAFRPGVNRENTSYANEGGYYESEKVRFRSGQPEKIGGWTKDAGPNSSALKPTTGTLWGVCRSMFNWLTLAGYNLLGMGTSKKYYIQNSQNGAFYDVTPLKGTPPGLIHTATNAFGTTASPAGTARYVTVACNVSGHGAQTGDFMTISGVAGTINGIPASALNKEFVVTYVSVSQVTVEVYVDAATAVTAGTTGNAFFAVQITIGSDVYTVGLGWGAGGWGGVTSGYSSTGWGDAAPAGVGIGVQLRLWSHSNFGQNIVLNPRGGGLYYWVVSSSPSTFARAQVVSASNTNTQDSVQYWLADSTCPTVCNFVLVSDGSRFTIAFGCNDPTGVYATSVLDPMQIRWTDQENLLKWTPAITNQAGDYRLSRGSTIVTAQQTRQEILVFTDAALYSMQYLGPPYVWGFQILGDNISIAGPNAVATASHITYWMGTDKFYTYSGRVDTLPSTLREYVYSDINLEQAYQIISGTNEGYSEVWWSYCSSNSNVLNRYVVYNYTDNVWYYGTWLNYNSVNAGRTSWLDSALRPYPMATAYGEAGGNSNAVLVYHESSTDDGLTNPPSPIVAYVQSSDFDIGDGHNYGFVWRLIPDLTFDGSTSTQPRAYFTIRPRTFPGAAYGTANNPAVVSAQNYQTQQTYLVQLFTEQVYVRLRGRQMAVKVSSGTYGSATDGLGVQWQLGISRIDIRPDGRN